MSYFFTADPHYGDSYMLGYAGRRFENLEEMNKAMLTNSNTRVGPDDTLIFIGDFCSLDYQYFAFYKHMLSKIKGKKILVLGNHDKLEPFKYIEAGFYSVHTHLEMTIDGIDMVIVHDSSNSCMDRSKLFLCGHSHDLFRVKKNVISLCVELWNYFPVSWETIKCLYYEKVILTQGE